MYLIGPSNNNLIRFNRLKQLKLEKIMIKTYITQKKFNYYTLIFLSAFILLILIELLLIKMKLGLFTLTGVLLLLTVLMKPKWIFLLLISTFAAEGFASLPGTSYPKIIGIILMIGLFFRLTLTKEAIPKDDSYKYFVLFFIGSLVSFAFAKDPTISLKMYITYISLFFLYISTRYFLQNMETINQAMNYLFFSTLIVFAFVHIMGLSVKAKMISRISSGIGDPNAFALYLLVLIPLVLYRAFNSRGFLRILYWIFIISFLLLLIFTGSRGGVLGFIGMSAILIWHCSVGRVKQILFFILTIFIIAFFFIPDDFWVRISTIMNPEDADSSINTRLENYQAALKMFLDYPFAGVGFYNFPLISKSYGASRELVIHNAYLEILTGGGLLSFIPFMMIIVNCWRKLKIQRFYDKNLKDLFICLRASFVSILITSFFISGDHKKILWFLLALISSAFYIAIKSPNLKIKMKV